MRRSSLFVPSLLLLSLLACDTQPESEASPSSGSGAAASRAPRTPLPPDALMLQRVTIDDPGVIAAMPAMSVLVPAGWRTRGGVATSGGPCPDAYTIDWQATSPDGRSTVSLFPTEVWNASTMGVSGSCMPGDYDNARAYLTARVERAFPGAQVTEYRAREDYTAPVAERAQREQQLFVSMGSNTRVSADGGEVLFSFTQDGVEMQGTAGVSAIFYVAQTPNPMGGPPFLSLTGATLGTYGATAPKGALDLALVEAVRRSVVPTGEWLQRLFAIQAQRGAAAVQATRDRAAIIVAGGAAATKANIESFQRMSGYSRATGSDGGSGGGSTGGRELYPGESTDDRIQRRSLEAIRGVDTYLDPVSNTPVQLDHSYGNAWRVTGQDAYILTKNPNFNPGQYGIEATAMKVIR